MALETPCQTPGANFSTHLTDKGFTLTVTFGRAINMTQAQAQVFEANLHNAAELVMAPHFTDAETAREALFRKWGGIRHLFAAGDHYPYCDVCGGSRAGVQHL